MDRCIENLTAGLLAFLLTGCASPPGSVDEHIIHVEFENPGDYTWLGLLMPEGHPTGQQSEEIWLCRTESTVCALNLRDVNHGVELIAVSIGRAVYRRSINHDDFGDGKVNLNIKFRSGGLIVGEIQDMQGEAIDSATIEISKHEAYWDTLPEEARKLFTKSVESGMFKVAGLGPGRYSAVASTSDHIPLALDFEVGDEGSVSLQFELSSRNEASVLRGHVFDARSLAQIEEFRVEITPSQSHRAPLVRRLENAAGLFEWSGLPHGRYDISISANEFSTLESWDVELPPNGILEEEFGLHVGRTVRGQVVDTATRAPIPHASITLTEPSFLESSDRAGQGISVSVSTDESGRFNISGLPETLLSISAKADGYVSSEGGIVYETQEVLEVPLSVGATVLGRIPEYDSAGEADRATASLKRSGHSEYEEKVTNVDREGTFKFNGIAPGLYSVEVNHATRQGWGNFEIAPGDLFGEVEIQYLNATDAAARVRGRVTGLFLDEIAKVESMPQAYSARVDPIGDYELQFGSVRAIWGIRLSTNRGRTLTRTLQFEEGQVLISNFNLRGTSRLRGRVLRNGDPVSDVVVSARFEEMDESTSELRIEYLDSHPTSRNGEYEVPGVSNGEYSLWIKDRRRNVLVNGDTRLDVDLCVDIDDASYPYFVGGRLVCDDLSIFGRVRSGGKSLSRVSLMVLGNKLGPRLVTSDDRGAFEVRDLIPDQYRIAVYKSGFDPASARVDLSSEAATQSGRAEVPINLIPGKSSPFWVTGPQAPLRFVVLELLNAHRERLWFPLPVDAVGKGYLPLAVSGQEFTLRHPSVQPARLSDWQGQSFRVDFADCQESPRVTCMGWSWQGGADGWPYSLN